MSKPRRPSFGAGQRSRLARRAATARWARLVRGVLTLDQIRDAVVKALAEREAKLAPGGAGIRPGLPLLPEPPCPGRGEAKATRKAQAQAEGVPLRCLWPGRRHRRDEIYILIVEKMPEDLMRRQPPT
jgi:hypothetical protein